MLCVTVFVLQQNKTCDLTCIKIFLVRLYHKIVGLDLAPFTEKVENHWFILCRSRRHAVITRIESRDCSTLLCKLTHNLAVTHALDSIKIYYPTDIFSLVSRSLSMNGILRFGWSLQTMLRFFKCR